MLACNVCEFECVSLTEYLKHCRSHRHLNNVLLSCGHKDCGRRFSSLNCLAVHMSRTHTRIRQRWNQSVSVQLKCLFNFCSREYADVKRLVSYLSNHIQEGLTVTCPFDGCSKTFNVSLYVHTWLCLPQTQIL